MTTADASTRKPLSGIKVLDFTHLLAGPYCTMLLGDMGADVVKVEPPGGDSTRHQGPPFHQGLGLTYLAANRNKRSVTLDLRNAEARAVGQALAAKADVIVQNFRPGVMERLGLDYVRLAKVNPRLVYCSLSGFGLSGPLAEKGAFDLTIQAIGGYMSITGERGGAPVKLGTSAFDLVAGLHALSGILAALVQRDRTGRGEHVQTSLLEGEVAFLVNAGLEAVLAGTEPTKWGSEHAQAVPYKAFQVSDGWIAIAAAVQPLFEAFVKVIGLEELIRDPRFATPKDRVTHRTELYDILDRHLLNTKVEELVRQLDAVGVPCAPVNSVGEVMRHPQVLECGMLKEVQHPSYGVVSLIGSAIKFADTDLSQGWRAPPLLGEHTQDVIKEWGG